MLRWTLRLAAPVAALLLLSAPATASPREETVRILDSLRASNASLGLRAWVNDPSQNEIVLGQPIVYHFSAVGDAYVTSVHVDSHGVVNVLLPSDLWKDNRIGADGVMRIPAEQDAFELEARPPLGMEVLVVVATPEPITAEMLGLSFDDSPIAQFDAPEAPAFAERLRRVVNGLDATTVAIARVEQRVVARKEGPQYRSAEVVDYFAERTRGISRPRLDMHISFETASAVLSEAARADLDEIGRALNQSSLQARRFRIAGHTDDVGTEAYNYDLSRRRAQSVYRYLVENHAVAPGRLEVEALGESQPIETGSSPAARRMNRRVELELIR